MRRPLRRPLAGLGALLPACALLLVAAPARAEDPSFGALLDAARASILRGGYAAARELLDRAEEASVSSSEPPRVEDVARLGFYRGAVEWYAGDRDGEALRDWRAAAVVSKDLEPSPDVLPDSQARDAYYAVREDVRSGPQVALAFPDGATIFVDGRRSEPSDSVAEGRHLVQVRCASGTLAGAWYRFGHPPPDYLAICTGGAYPADPVGAEVPADDPLNAVCPRMTPAELVATVARGREALFEEDFAQVAAVDTELGKRLPCMRGDLVEPAQWAPHLITLAIAAHARNVDWQTPLASALTSMPRVPRAVGAGHPVGAWMAPPEAASSRAVPPGVELYVDGRRAAFLLPLSGPHLVQIRDGGHFVTRYLPNGEADVPWDELLAPFVQVAAPAETGSSSTASVKRRSPGPLKVGLLVGGGVVAAGGGGLLAYAYSQEQALLGDERQLREWALAGKTAESVAKEPAVQGVNTLYTVGFATAGLGVALSVIGVVVPVSVLSVDGTPTLTWSGAW